MSDADKTIHLSSGSIFLIIFGLIFAGMGTFFLITLLNDPSSVKVNGRPGTVGDAWFPCIFIAIGLIVAGFRGGKMLNMEEKTLTSWWGWLFFVKHTEKPLGTWLRIEVCEREMRGSRKSKRSVVPVRLVGDQDIEELAAPSNEVAACQLAERVAKGAKIPMADKSSGTVVERDHTHLDDSILLHITDADLKVPAPEKTRIHISEGIRGRKMVIGLSPALLLAPIILVPFLFALAFWYFAWYPGLSDKVGKDLFHTLFAFAPLIMFGGIPFIFGLFTALRKGLFGFSVTADSDTGMRILGQRIMVSDLEDLRVMGGGNGAWRGRYLAAITDKKWIKFGYGLRSDDLLYLRALILQGLSGRR